ncbi:HemX homolog protein [Piscinibacter sakaiensis]|uniref:HemX homolog protein n=1 Tax=Piscinibacter sakaiensis TaxID=1547922 RepID=A0A0K8P436_PISS1|nr:HemX homolog protein [Piscinibacter sakaiensis]
MSPPPSDGVAGAPASGPLPGPTAPQAAASPAAPPAPASPAAALPPAAPPAASAPTAPPAGPASRLPTLVLALAGIGLAAGAIGLWQAWRTEERLHQVEQALVGRQEDSQRQSAEARLLAQQTQDGLREAQAKVALLEARLSEVAVQRGQLEDLIQSLSRSRDENIVVDIESALRVAQQQSALSGSAEPLVATLRQADERLARYNQPRLEGVRRAIARDLDRVRKAGVADIGALVIRLDEAVRLVDDLPLLSVAEPPRAAPMRSAAPARGAAPAAASGAAPAASGTLQAGLAWLDEVGERMWQEVRSLVRVTRIDRPEAMLIAPDQAYFLRENMKLRLLNARLALLSRQFDTAQSDLASVQSLIERYHDRSSRRTQLAQEMLRQVAAQARQAGLPRPDDTLAALAAAAAGK